MAGILNNKTRILDVLLTSEGKKQMANGTLRANFYSFSDSSAVYSRDTIVSGGLSETHRFILEASDSPYDQITFESNDAGALTAFPISGSEKFSIINGQIFSGSQENKRIAVTGSVFSSIANDLLSSSIDSFKKQMILKSPEFIDDLPVNYAIGKSEVCFEITNTAPFQKNDITTANVDHIESFFQDKRLSHIPNFMFLPPVNKRNDGTSLEDPLSIYMDVKQADIVTKQDLDNELREFEKKGYKHEISFLETSTENNTIAQMFEISNDSVRKLDIIDFGSFQETNEHVFFVGKIFIDDSDSETFVHMFTLVFSG